jgi:hypothetical protein
MVSLTDTFAIVAAGSDAVTITATVTGPGGDQGVSWDLSIANTSCSPSCGTLKPASAPSTSAVYTPPKNVPANETATITARAIADQTQTFVFNFQITPAITILITDKFDAQTAGGPVTDIHAQVTNDATNAGLSWTLTAGGITCAPLCGTLTADPAPSSVAHYQPPATAPASTDLNASPTISAISIATPRIKDTFNFIIVAPPVSLWIVNKFSSQPVGGPAVAVNATVTNDVGNAGLTWTLTTGGGSCSPECGTLVPAAAPSTSATYTPPTTLPLGIGATPTITASSVADPGMNDSFSFTIANATAALSGHYAFLLRGFNPSGTSPVAIAGAFVADGAGGITNAEFELNNGGSVVSFPAPMTGSYVVNSAQNGIPRVTISFAGTPLVLKCALSSDGKRGQIIQLDNSGFLTAGTLSQQDAAALAGDPAGNYAFGVDSDAPVGQRIVEAGQFVLGTGGTSVTGGLADAMQYAGANPVAGGINGGTAIAADAATAPDALGRGTLTLNVGGTAVQYSYYVTDGQQLSLLEIDSGAALQSLFSGTAKRQQTLDANTINSTGVVALTGMNVVNSAVVPDSVIGVLAVSGSGSTATYDTNNGTTASTQLTTAGFIPSGSIPSAAFDPATGRVLIANNPTATPFVGVAALYYYDLGKAYVIDITPNNNAGAFSHALSGQLLPQATGPFSASSDLAGNLVGRAGGSSTAGPANVDFATTFDGASNYSLTLDLTTTNTSLGSSGQVVDYSETDQFQVNDATTGHGLLQLLGGALGDPTPTTEDIVSFYLIGPKQFVAIGNQAGVPSGVLFFAPQ